MADVTSGKGVVICSKTLMFLQSSLGVVVMDPKILFFLSRQTGPKEAIPMKYNIFSDFSC